MPAPTKTATQQYTPFSRKLTGSLDQISKNYAGECQSN